MTTNTADRAGPDFIGIGTRRSASTNMHQLLNAHPEVEKPDVGLHAFTTAGIDGADVYRAAFPVRTDGKTRADISVSYLYPEHAPNAARDIAQHFPDARLFATLRDPVARAFSDYMRSVMLKEIDGAMGFRAACEAHPEFIERSRYIRLLEPYWDTAGQDGVKLFFYEAMRRDKRAHYAEMARFFEIGLEPFLAPIKGETGHAHAVRSDSLQRIVLNSKTALRGGARRIGMERPWNAVTRALQPVYQKVLRLNGREVSISAEEIAYVTDKLGHDTHRFMVAACVTDDLGWQV